MDNIEFDLNNIGKKKYSYNEVFKLSDYKKYRDSGKAEVYKNKLKSRHDVNEKIQEMRVHPLFYLSALTFFLPFVIGNSVTIIPLLVIFITSLIAGIVVTKNSYKTLKAELKSLEGQVESLTKESPFTTYFDKYVDYYSYFTVWVNFKKICNFLDKLDNYEDITAYHLDIPLEYPTEKYTIHFTDMMFKDDTTNQYFTYAYSTYSYGKETKVGMMTIFDIDIDTFEYKPRK